jgi:hypothetical protein
MAGLDDRSSAPILFRNQDRPASVARAATPMASALLKGLSLADHVRPAGTGGCSSGVASCAPLLIGAPHDPQKRFPGGFSLRHRGHGICRSVMVCLSSFPCPNNLLTLHQLLTLSERPNPLTDESGGHSPGRVCQELSEDLKSLSLARDWFPPQPHPLGAAE